MNELKPIRLRPNGYGKPSYFTVTSSLGVKTAGTAFQITVTALDDGNIIKAYGGTIHFTSSDGSATLPADTTFTNGQANFNVTASIGGMPSFTVTDTVNSLLTGTNYFPVIDTGSTFYWIDPDNGSDSNNGTSINTPWQTAAKINAHTLAAGDIFQIKGNTTAALAAITLTGTANSPAQKVVCFCSYGGTQAKINFADNNHGIYINNVTKVIVSDIIATGSGITVLTSPPAANWTVSYAATLSNGIHALNTSVTTHLLGPYINNVNASGCWIGIQILADGTNLHGFDNSVIANCITHETLFTGITMRANYTTAIHQHLNPILFNNQVSNSYGTQTASNIESKGGNTGYGVIIEACDNCVMQYHLVHDCGQCNVGSVGGPCGIIYLGCNGGTCSDFEIHHQFDFTGIDGEGSDIESCQNVTFQRGYTHDNHGEGYLFFSFAGQQANSSNTFRYCNSQNDGLTGAGTSVSGVRHTNNGTSINNVVTNCTFYADKSIVTATKLVGSNSTGMTLTDCILIARNGMVFGSIIDNPVSNFYDTDGTFNLVYNGTTYTSLAALQAAGGEKVSGTTYGFVGTANVLNAGNGTAQGATFYPSHLTAYDLTASATAVGNALGANVLSIATGTQDFHHRANNYDGLRSIGAVEAVYQSFPYLSITCGASQNAGTAFNVTVTAKNADGSTNTGYTGIIKFTTSDTNAPVLPSNYTFLVGDNGVKTFTNGVTLNTSGSQSIRVTDTITSSRTGHVNLTVVATVPNKLLFGVQPPSSVIINVTISPAVTVKVADTFGNTVTGDNSRNITIALTSGSGLTGTLTQADASGVSTFNDLVESVSGTYTLTATTSGLTSATSSSFTAGPVVYLSDTFTDANGTLITAHTPDVGAIPTSPVGNAAKINNNVLIYNVSNDNTAVYQAGSGHSDVTMTWDFNFKTESSAPYIPFPWFRYTDTNNYWDVLTTVASPAPQIRETVAGVTNNRGTAGSLSAWVNNTTYNMKLVMAGASISFYVNNSLITSYGSAGSGLTATKFGFDLYSSLNSMNSTIDNFKVTA